MAAGILRIPGKMIDEKNREAQINKAAQNCDAILVSLSTKLGIPDLNDKEVIILVDDKISEPSFEIEFTVGPNEYPDFKGHEKFEPDDDLIKVVGEEIQDKVHKSLFGITKTTLKVWADTTYVYRDDEEEKEEEAELAETSIQHHEETSYQDAGKYIDNPSLTLYLRRGKEASVSVGAEREPSKEDDPNMDLAKEMSRRTADILGLPEIAAESIHVKYADYADVNASVFFDCKPQTGHELSEGARQRVASEIMGCMDKQKGFVEAWIRHDKPKIFTFETTKPQV